MAFLLKQKAKWGEVRWYVIGVNPEPWAVGPVQTGRRNGKVFATMGQNQQLASFKEAVREELGEPDYIAPEGTLIRMDLFFWRRLDDYETESGRRHRKHEADMTNMQKACEDALQGVVIHNDRDVAQGHVYVMEQGREVTGKIVIRLEPMSKQHAVGFPIEVHQELEKIDNPVITVDPNAWPPVGGF